MTTETVTIEVEAPTDDARRSLEALTNASMKFGQQVTRSLTSAIQRGEDLDDVFRSLALSIANTALNAGLMPLQDILSNGFGNILSAFTGAGSRQGGGVLAALGSISPFARGGVVSAPSFFPLDSGLGLAGEAGPEAILPLQRGSDGRLGIGSSNGASSSNITINITTPDVTGFRQSEAQVTSALARALQRSRRTL